jgi:site-specific recombinase XerD
VPSNNGMFDVNVLLAESAAFTSARLTSNTRKSYAFDWQQFVQWCVGAGRESLPASNETVTCYLTDLLRTRKISTAGRRAAAINFYHRQAGVTLPADYRTHELLHGAQRIKCEEPLQKMPLGIEHLRRICGLLREAATPIAIRNQAVLVLGMAGAFRRSTIAGLDLEDVHVAAEGLVIRVKREKQDRKGIVREVPLASGTHPDTCCVRTLRAWLDVRGTAPGPLFWPMLGGKALKRRLHPNRIAEIVKAAVKSVALDPLIYSSHSMRRGMITEALLRGVDSVVLAGHTGHKSMTSLRRYFFRTSPWRENPSGLIGL